MIRDSYVYSLLRFFYHAIKALRLKSYNVIYKIVYKIAYRIYSRIRHLLVLCLRLIPAVKQYIKTTISQSHLVNNTITWLLSKQPKLLKYFSSFGYLEKLSSKSLSNSKKSNQRSVLFLHNCYYNFYYLAKALRERGWDAISVSMEDLKSPNSQFFHGSDLNLYNENPELYKNNIINFFNEAKSRFKMVHFYGGGGMSFFPEFFSKFSIPFDFLELKRLGIKIGYSHNGCLDLVSKDSFRAWSNNCCNKCCWKNNPSVCSNQINLAWGKKVSAMCDLICIETDPMLDYKNGPNVYLDPLTFALCEDHWTLKEPIPEKFVLPKKPGEIFVLHSMGNHKMRTKDMVNIKGTSSIFDAVQRLQSEGYLISLMFHDDVKSYDMRYIQAQADIAVDQLNYGRHGATARETMMLGVPTICNLNLDVKTSGKISEYFTNTPIIHADEQSVYDVLKDLVISSEKRKAIGLASREYAIKWWGAKACAQRFESVYDKLQKS